MQIGELAAATNLSRDTLRFYEKRGLLLSRRLSNGYRDYPPEAVQWLCYVRAAQSDGHQVWTSPLFVTRSSGQVRCPEPA